jgi:hypothetical protein
MASISVTFLDRTFTVEYPDAVKGVILDDLCERYGYQPLMPNPTPGPTEPPMIANTEDKIQFVVNRIVAELLQPSKNKLRQAAMQQADVAAQKQIEAAFGGVSISEVKG